MWWLFILGFQHFWARSSNTLQWNCNCIYRSCDSGDGPLVGRAAGAVISMLALHSCCSSDCSPTWPVTGLLDHPYVLSLYILLPEVWCIPASVGSIWRGKSTSILKGDIGQVWQRQPFPLHLIFTAQGRWILAGGCHWFFNPSWVWFLNARFFNFSVVLNALPIIYVFVLPQTDKSWRAERVIEYILYGVHKTSIASHTFKK